MTIAVMEMMKGRLSAAPLLCVLAGGPHRKHDDGRQVVGGLINTNHNRVWSHPLSVAVGLACSFDLIATRVHQLLTDYFLSRALLLLLSLASSRAHFYISISFYFLYYFSVPFQSDTPSLPSSFWSLSLYTSSSIPASSCTSVTSPLSLSCRLLSSSLSFSLLFKCSLSVLPLQLFSPAAVYSLPVALSSLSLSISPP